MSQQHRFALYGTTSSHVSQSCLKVLSCAGGSLRIPVLAILLLVVAITGAAQPLRGRNAMKPLLFLGNEALPPMVFSRNGMPAGIVVDLARALGRELDSPVEIRVMNWEKAQELVRDGRADALLQINPSPERLEYLDFSQALMASEFTIFIPADAYGVHSSHDLRGQKVGVESQGRPRELLMAEPGILMEVLPDLESGFRMLAEGSLDAVVADRWVGLYILAEHRIKGIKAVEAPISRSYSAIAVRKGEARLLADINAALTRIKKNGTYDAILESWRSKEVAFRTFEQLNRMEQATVAAILAALVIALLAVWGQFTIIRKQRRTELLLRESERAIKKSESRMHAILETMPEGVAVADARTLRFVFVNASFARMLGYERDEVYSLGPPDIHPPHEGPRIAGNCARLLNGESCVVKDIEVIRKDHSVFLADIETIRLEMDDKPCFLGVFTDITERKASAEKISTLLREKELLLKETHHRIKNNMNTVYSLLSLQARAQTDRQLEAILLDAAGRVQGMRLLYDKLYLSGNFHELGVRTFFPPLIDEILGVFNLNPPVAASLELDDFALSARMLSPLSIIVNELVTNSVKYAFEGMADRKIRLQARKSGSTVTMIYEDNGIGLPASVNLEKSTGFGMQLVGMLVQQMDGTISIDSQGGTKYTITVMV